MSIQLSVRTHWISGLLEYIFKLKIRRNNWLLTRVCKQPIIALYFEFENELKFDNLDAWILAVSLMGS